MDQEKAYRKFKEATLSNPSKPGAFPPHAYHIGGNAPYVSPPPSFEMDKQVVNDVRRAKKLATVEMVLSCMLLVFGMISTGLAADNFYYHPCVMGASIWAPVLGIVADGLGLGALKYGDYSRRCLLISHFVMCIISAVASGILVVFSCVCLESSVGFFSRSFVRYNDNYYRPGLAEALIVFESLILAGALAHMIATIVSTAFICRYFYSRTSNAGTTTLHIPAAGANGNGPIRAISVPAGAQVVFVPSSAGP